LFVFILRTARIIFMIVSKKIADKSKKGESMKKKFLLSLCCAAATLSATAVIAMPDKAAPPATSAAQPAAEALTGKILETMDSGGYTYMHIQKKNGDKIWVAVTVTPVKVGSQISFKGGAEMTNFESKTLKRTFEKIVFADGVISTPQAKGKEIDKGASLGSKGAVAGKDAKISVSKAAGANAYTVKEIFSDSAKLNKKKVMVKGKVVKVSAQIMGKNWIHIQDGTGTATAKNHDLVATSKESVDVGDVVTVSGTLAKDKDFGGGYKYAVIIEDATVKK
jgi:hypothetical protein